MSLYVPPQIPPNPVVIETLDDRNWGFSAGKGCSVNLRTGFVFPVRTGGHVIAIVNYSGSNAVGTAEVAQPAEDVENVLHSVRKTRNPQKLDELEDRLSELGRGSSALIRDAFRSADEPPHVRAVALRALVRSERQGALEYLLAGLSDSSSRVREVAAAEAADFLPNEAVAAELRKMEATEPSEIVRELAVDALRTL